MHEIDMKNYKIRTDLVIDELFNYTSNDGIISESITENNIGISKIRLNKENILNKKEGHYITISFDDVTDKTNRENLILVFTKYLKELIDEFKLNKVYSSLVVGLGNIKSTPDSLGPKVAEKILVTRYLFNEEGVSVQEGYNNVSAIVPGVSGTTGIESNDIIKGIVDKIKPDFVIVIDALASSSIDRINKTIQMTNTGIMPGSGVGNKRKEISSSTLNVPVIAIGIPTVIDGVTIVSDTINYMIKKFSYSKNATNLSEKFAVNRNYINHEENLSYKEKEKLLGVLGTLTDEEIKQLIFEVLSPINYNLMVTVKEIDFVIEKLVDVLSTGINKTIHPKLNE